jgi:hypothetical protein
MRSAPHSALAYFNLCAAKYDMGQTGADAVAACDKAIAADPKKADAYFIKGSILFGHGTMDKNNRITCLRARWKLSTNIPRSLLTARTLRTSSRCLTR